jgi:hypothetical protein
VHYWEGVKGFIIQEEEGGKGKLTGHVEEHAFGKVIDYV